MKTRILFSGAKRFRLQILLIVFSGLHAGSVFSQPITWLGSGADTLSDNPTSWEGGVLPTASSDIIIPNGSAQLHVNTNATWSSITFTGGNLPSGMSVGTGITLTVTGSITIQPATASRGIFDAGLLSCSVFIGGTNTSSSGNLVVLVGSATFTVQSDVSGCNLIMFNSTASSFGGNFTGGSLDVQNNNEPTIHFNSTDPQTVPAGTYARIFFEGGGTKTLAGPITITSDAGFTSGIVINSSPIFFDGSFGGLPSVAGGSSLSFATGPVRWLRQAAAGAFTFPVGKQGAGYHPVTVDPLLISPTDFTVEYIRSSGAALGPVTAPGILTVSNCEYWNINRTVGASADVTLTWSSTSGCGGGTYITDLPSLRVVHFNGTNWDFSGIAGGTGTAAVGSVSWFGVTDFSPFTIGTTSLLNALPVVLADFSASRCGNNICLYWKTASENNNDHFEIERSADGRMFSLIGNVNGNGTTSDPHDYTFRDDHPLDGMNYYRVKQVNTDGKLSYSPAIRIGNSSVGAFSASITPNPAGSVMNLVIEGVKDKENLLFEVMNTNGMIVYRESISAGGTTMVKNLRRPAISAGLYFYKITRSLNNEAFNGKLVLQ